MVGMGALGESVETMLLTLAKEVMGPQGPLVVQEALVLLPRRGPLVQTPEMAEMLGMLSEGPCM